MKDGINDYLIDGNAGCGKSSADGHKGFGPLQDELEPGKTASIRLRLTTRRPAAHRQSPFNDFERNGGCRRSEADEFYESHHPAERVSKDEARVMRQAFAGMLWSKQYFVSTWTNGWWNMASIRCGQTHQQSAIANGST